MNDFSYGQAYAEWQAELRESAARASAARRAAGGRWRRRPDRAPVVSTSGHARKMTDSKTVQGDEDVVRSS